MFRTDPRSAGACAESFFVLQVIKYNRFFFQFFHYFFVNAHALGNILHVTCEVFVIPGYICNAIGAFVNGFCDCADRICNPGHGIF